IVIEFVDNDSNTQPQKAVELSHPFGIALGQVIVDSDHMHAVSGERVQVNGKGGDQGLAFTGLHFSNIATMQDDAADKLDIEVAHVEHAPASLTRNRKSFRKNLFQNLLAGLQALGFILNTLQPLPDAALE